MAFNFRDIVNHKINKANNQESFDIKKKRLKMEGISVEDLLKMKLNKKMFSE